MSEKSGFEELMSQGTAIVTHPVTPWLALGVIALFWILSQVDSKIPEDPIERLKRIFGAEKIPHGVALIAALLWGALVLTLTFGLITLLFDIVWNTIQPVGREAKADFQFLLTKTAALTAVLGAMIALPFTALRLKLTATQTRHAEDVLFNEKLNDANTDLHARYQTSEKQENGYLDVWKDDIIRRNGAIDRLEALAIERPAMAPRIARMLCVYLREMTRDYPAEVMPLTLDKDERKNWPQYLGVKRSDMQTAAQVLGRLHVKTKVRLNELAIDLSGVNLQAMQLSQLNFGHASLNDAALDGANLEHSNFTNTSFSKATCMGTNFFRATLLRANMRSASLQHAILEQTELQYTQLQGANLSNAALNGVLFYWTAVDKRTSFENAYAYSAGIFATDLSEAKGVNHLISNAFGASGTSLPDYIERPLHWPTVQMSESQLIEEWRDFQMQGIQDYIPPQLREK